jgi:two-component sensor histidine kinase
MTNKNKLCILVCEFFEKEASAIIQAEGFDDVMVAAFPSRCGRPQVTWDELDQVVRPPGDYSRIHLLGGCCTARLSKESNKKVLARRGQNTFVKNPGQCFYMLAGREIIDSYLKEGVYLVTPGWIKGWRDRLKEWGFEGDMEKVREFFGESTARLVLLDTGIDPKSSEYLREFAGFVDRPFEVLPVGLDFFRLFLTKIVLQWRLGKNEPVKTPDDARRRTADYAMSLELLSKLTRVMNGKEVAANILDLFTMLFAPGKLYYLPYEDGKPGEILPVSRGDVENTPVEQRLVNFRGDYTWTGSGKGFLLRIAYGDETLGILEVDDIAFPEYKEHYLNLALSIAPVCGLAIKNASTYQRIKHAEDKIRDSLAEKEMLLKEIHHRVKNNLQVIYSFLELQSLYIEDKKAIEAFKNSQKRVQAMAIIHEKLYKSKDLSKINFRKYLSSLILSLFDSYHLMDRQVRLEIQVEDVFLDIDTSIPLGLVINELVSNSLKHAFPDGRKGELRVNLEESEDKEYDLILTVEDNGIGFPEGLDFEDSNSLGMRIVSALVRQIHGTIDLDGTEGTRFTIKFKKRKRGRKRG